MFQYSQHWYNISIAFCHYYNPLISVLPFFAKNWRMQIIIVGSEKQKEELLSGGITKEASLIWLNDLKELEHQHSADVYIDLLFENTQKRIKLLAQFLPKLVIINSVIDTLAEINSSFVRINGWPTFLSSNIIEASSLQKQNELEAEEVFSVFEKCIEWLPDIPGFITPRVISMIINEAYFALAEGVSTPNEIDIAMKLGTAYPYGPLNWGVKIGLQNIVTLLEKLSVKYPRYMPCELLVQETNRSI